MDDDDKPKPKKKRKIRRERLSHEYHQHRMRPDDRKVVYLDAGRKRKPGRPSFVPTADERRLVHTMIANGIPHAQIWACINNPYTDRPIDHHTFVSAFAHELRTAKAQVDTAVGAALVQRALGRKPRVLFEETVDKDGGVKVNRKVIEPGCEADTTAIIWYEKTRRGFKEGHVVEHCGPDGQPLPSSSGAVQHTIIVLPAGRSTDDYVKTIEGKPSE